jgi:hypothetical protein
VIGGLISSTILTLFVLPAIYRFFEPKSFVHGESHITENPPKGGESEAARKGSAVPAPHMLESARKVTSRNLND